MEGSPLTELEADRGEDCLCIIALSRPISTVSPMSNVQRPSTLNIEPWTMDMDFGHWTLDLDGKLLRFRPGVITAPGTSQQLGPVQQLNNDRPPFAVPRRVARFVAEAVDHRQVFNHLFVDHVEIA